MKKEAVLTERAYKPKAERLWCMPYVGRSACGLNSHSFLLSNSFKEAFYVLDTHPLVFHGRVFVFLSRPKVNEELRWITTNA